MKAAMFLPPPTSLQSGGALNKRKVYLSILCLIIVTLWNTHSVTGAPAELDSLDPTFALGLQPPIFEATVSEPSPPSSQPKGDNDATTIDSYGNPIVSLQPIDTPDGRKVVSAQGLQFEIPNYASGITELKKPADDLLPPFIDKIGSSGEDVKTKSNNPFLSRFDDGKYKTQSATRRTTITTTATTTTTASPEINEKNPFESTIPPWLKDFDDPDVGPGVPFVYDPDEDENDVDEDILPPSKAVDSNKTNTPSTSPFLNSQTPQGFTNKFASSAMPLISSSSIPSIATLPLPSTQTNQDDSTLTRPHTVFVPPQPKSAEGIIIADNTDDLSKKTSSTFNKNFAAPFDSAADSNSATATTGGDPKTVPLSADRESFPPFNNVITGSSTIPSKTTFTKSEDGKVITNNIFLSGNTGPASTKPIGSSQVVNNQEKNTLTTQSSTSSTFTTSAAASGFITSGSSLSSSSTTFGSTSTSNGLKYTGNFGGPPGVLAPQGTSFTASNTDVTKSYNKPALSTFGVTSSTGLAINNNDKFTGSFGGPPGILKPYDNVKNRESI